MDHSNIFYNIYENKVWGDNEIQEYKGYSGGGSELSYNKDTYIPFLKKYIQYKNIYTIVDLGCGDFVCGPYIYNNLDIKYYGYDVYDKIINYHNNIYKDNDKYNFVCLDIYNNKEQIINADLCILKDILQHWSLEEIYNFLDYIVDNKKFKYILICNCANQVEDNTDIKTGEGRPLNSDYYPLKKYNPIRIFSYNTKEVCVIKLDNP